MNEYIIKSVLRTLQEQSRIKEPLEESYNIDEVPGKITIKGGVLSKTEVDQILDYLSMSAGEVVFDGITLNHNNTHVSLGGIDKIVTKGATLSNLSLDGLVFKKFNLTKTKLINFGLRDSNFNKIKIKDCDLSHVDFEKSIFEGGSFDKAILPKDMAGVRFNKVDFKKSIIKTKFDKSDFTFNTITDSEFNITLKDCNADQNSFVGGSGVLCLSGSTAIQGIKMENVGDLTLILDDNTKLTRGSIKNCKISKLTINSGSKTNNRCLFGVMFEKCSFTNKDDADIIRNHGGLVI